MLKKRKLPMREQVFVLSLLYHGFRLSSKRKNLKLRRGYVMPATAREDSAGVDFWVKMPNDRRHFPVQVTQRGIKLFRLFHEPNIINLSDDDLANYQKELEVFNERLKTFIEKTDARIRHKRNRCRRHGVAFVLVRDYAGRHTSRSIAWGDLKALKYAIANMRRWL